MPGGLTMGQGVGGADPMMMLQLIEALTAQAQQSGIPSNPGAGSMAQLGNQAGMANDPGFMGMFEQATGMPMDQAMMGGGQQMPHGMLKTMEGTVRPVVPGISQQQPMPEIPPALQALLLKYMQEAEALGFTDPGEIADYAAAMMAAEGQGQ